MQSSTLQWCYRAWTKALYSAQIDLRRKSAQTQEHSRDKLAGRMHLPLNSDEFCEFRLKFWLMPTGIWRMEAAAAVAAEGGTAELDCSPKCPPAFGPEAVAVGTADCCVADVDCL